MEGPTQIIRQRRSFLSTLAMGLAALGITFMLAGAAIILYGMNIADRKSDNLFAAVEHAVRGLPELEKSLPPVLADLLDDRRRPDYLKQVEVAAKLIPAIDAGRDLRVVVDVRNKGEEFISLCSMRIVVLDENGSPVAEWNEWAATPFAAERNWRGPLLPGSTRHFATTGWRNHSPEFQGEELRVEVEITDVRVWKGESPRPGQDRQV
jgi:hypothetical protein